VLPGREIALNRVTEELKQEMDATKSFCLKKAFNAIDDWKYLHRQEEPEVFSPQAQLLGFHCRVHGHN